MSTVLAEPNWARRWAQMKLRTDTLEQTFSFVMIKRNKNNTSDDKREHKTCTQLEPGRRHSNIYRFVFSLSRISEFISIRLPNVKQ